MFCPFCGEHLSRLTWFCLLSGRSLVGLRGINLTDRPNMLQQCIQYFNEGHPYAVIVDMSCVHNVHNSLRSLENKLNDAGMYCRKDYSSTKAVIRAVRLGLQFQCTLQHHYTDHYSGASSHMYGSSTNNQSIESSVREGIIIIIISSIILMSLGVSFGWSYLHILETLDASSVLECTMNSTTTTQVVVVVQCCCLYYRTGNRR